jgi:hypothetical protein
VAAADKKDQFRFTRPPRADSFMRWLGCGRIGPSPETATAKEDKKDDPGKHEEVRPDQQREA